MSAAVMRLLNDLFERKKYFSDLDDLKDDILRLIPYLSNDDRRKFCTNFEFKYNYSDIVTKLLAVYIKIRLFMQDNYLDIIPTHVAEILKFPNGEILDRKRIGKIAQFIGKNFICALIKILSREGHGEVFIDSVILNDGIIISNKYKASESERTQIFHHSGDTKIQRYDDDEHVQASIQVYCKLKSGDSVVVTSTGFIIPQHNGMPNYDYKSREGAILRNRQVSKGKRWEYSRPEHWKKDHAAMSSSPIGYKIEIVPNIDSAISTVTMRSGYYDNYTFEAESNSISICPVNCKVQMTVYDNCAAWDNFIELIELFTP